MMSQQAKFSEPTLQSFRGVFVIFLADLVKRIRQNIAVLAIPLLSGKARDYLHYFILGIVILVIIQFVFSYISYKRYKFHVGSNAFFLTSGIFKVSQIEIPFERIQNINLQQNLIQQVLNVVGLEIETAGNDKAEVTIKALDKDDAEHLQELLTEQKVAQAEDLATSVEVNEPNTNTSSSAKQNASKQLLFKLSFLDLLKVGISSNFFKGIGVILAFLSYIYNSFGDLVSNKFDIDLETQIQAYLPSLLSVIIGVVFIVIVIGVVLTVALTIIQYFELKLFAVDQNYMVQYGLLKRVNKLIKAKKTQVFEIETNPLRRFFKFSNVYISQASSEELNIKNKIGVVGVSKYHINLLFEALFGIKDYQSINFRSIKTQWLRFKVLSLRLLVLFSALSFFQLFVIQQYSAFIIVGLALLLIFLITLVYLSTRKSYVSISETMIKVGGGSIHTTTAFVELFKIQSIAVKQNLYQRRVGMCNLILYTASGSLKINYLKHQEARQMANEILFKIESNTIEWM
ncbi:PH domain-containing protein [Psychroflexus sp. ALD_RP9]|uniref:PH domain-containing protein n=1 Tax=Psychroflexus sp. ALD_RP9 TaxID=2777186 RepID=UPI001A8BF8AE|nr:PH domain-containing protein [Psychroflexus sp. ALD_RP9]QSS97264.1 PH domain-containing protein [Psychroflexus sp. ALD_RP9]